MATTTNKESKDSGKWNNEAHMKLCDALAQALVEAGSSAAQQKKKIMEIMNESGLSFTWEGIR